MALYSLAEARFAETSGSGEAGCFIRTACVVPLDNSDDSCWPFFFFQINFVFRTQVCQVICDIDGAGDPHRGPLEP